MLATDGKNERSSSVSLRTKVPLSYFFHLIDCVLCQYSVNKGQRAANKDKHPELLEIQL